MGAVAAVLLLATSRVVLPTPSLLLPTLVLLPAGSAVGGVLASSQLLLLLLAPADGAPNNELLSDDRDLPDTAENALTALLLLLPAAVLLQLPGDLPLKGLSSGFSRSQPEPELDMLLFGTGSLVPARSQSELLLASDSVSSQLVPVASPTPPLGCGAVVVLFSPDRDDAPVYRIPGLACARVVEAVVNIHEPHFCMLSSSSGSGLFSLSCSALL